MNKVFTDNSWKDYIYWQTEDRKTLKKINNLIEDICRNGNEGIGKMCIRDRSYSAPATTPNAGKRRTGTMADNRKYY